MTIDKHTEGPWRRDAESGYRCDVRSASGAKVALCFGLADLRPFKGESKSAFKTRYARYRKRCDADAHLISASPEFLAAARLILLADDMPDDHSGYDAAMEMGIQMLKKAVAKAVP